MSDFILEYDMLESIAKYSASLGKHAEEYSENLESKIIGGIGSITGPSSGYLQSAEDSVRDKIIALKQKSDAFYHYSEQISNLLEVAKQMDQEVADAIAGQRNHSSEHHPSMRLEDWKAKLTALLVTMSLPLLKSIADLLNSLQGLFDSLTDTIKRGYESLGGNHLASGVFNRIALFSDIAGLTVAGAGAVCLVNGKIFERINNEGLNYSGLNGSAKGDNVDLKSNILKTYLKMKGAEYEFLTGGMLAIDDNMFSGSLQALSGYDKGLQPDSAAFKLGRFAGDTASLVAGVAAFVAGGLGEIGGIFFDATGVGAIIGVPLTIVSSVAAGVGGAVLLKSANSLIKDGFSMMSGDGGISNEGAGEAVKSTLPSGVTSEGLADIASAPGKGGVTLIGRAFQKHAGDVQRAGTFTGEVTGNAAKNTEQGMNYLNQILDNPNSTAVVRNTKAYGDVLDIRMPDGTGVRYSADGKTFIGFLEKYTPTK